MKKYFYPFLVSILLSTNTLFASSHVSDFKTHSSQGFHYEKKYSGYKSSYLDKSGKTCKEELKSLELQLDYDLTIEKASDEIFEITWTLHRLCYKNNQSSTLEEVYNASKTGAIPLKLYFSDEGIIPNDTNYIRLANLVGVIPIQERSLHFSADYSSCYVETLSQSILLSDLIEEVLFFSTLTHKSHERFLSYALPNIRKEDSHIIFHGEHKYMCEAYHEHDVLTLVVEKDNPLRSVFYASLGLFLGNERVIGEEISLRYTN